MVGKWDFGQIGHQNTLSDPLSTPCESYQVSKTRSEGLWEPISTLEVGQQSKSRGWRPFRRTKWSENEIFGQIGHQHGPREPLPNPCGSYQVSKTHSECLWELFPTLKVGKKSRWRDLRPFRTTKWQKNEIFGQMGHQNGPLDPPVGHLKIRKSPQKARKVWI